MKRLVYIWFASVAVGNAQPRYEILNLESLGAPANDGVFARGVNNHGQVMGSYWTPGQTELRLFSYSFGTGMVDIGPSPARYMYGKGINDLGQLIGFGFAGPIANGYRYTPGVGYELLTGPGDDSEPQGINNHGQVTGWTFINGQERLFRYTDGVGLEDLGLEMAGLAINDRGDITGITHGSVFLYQDGVGVTLLGQGEGRAINNIGVIAGNTSLSPVGGSAFIYKDGTMQLLGNFGGSTEAWAMNNQNEIIGQARIEDQLAAFLWSEQNGIEDLNALIAPGSGWFLTGAFSINDRGQIVGDGFYNGKYSAFLLQPIPEPSTWALLVLGASTLVLLRRRRW